MKSESGALFNIFPNRKKSNSKKDTLIFKVTTKSAKETKQVGARLARVLEVRDVVLFIANLGSGKTTMIQGLVKALGGDEEALSPTFALIQTYFGKKVMHHLDFYRLKKSEISSLGLDDYFEGLGEITPGVIFIEWADRCKEVWPKERLEVRIKIKKKSMAREISIRPVGRRYKTTLQDLKKKWRKK